MRRRIMNCLRKALRNHIAERSVLYETLIRKFPNTLRHFGLCVGIIGRTDKCAEECVLRLGKARWTD